MIRPISTVRFSLAAFATLALNLPPSYAAPPGQITGSFRIVNTQPVGSQAKVRLEIVLVNHSAGKAAISEIGLLTVSPGASSHRGFPPPPAAMELESHGAGTLTVDYTLTSAELETLQRAQMQLFRVLLRNPDGSLETTSIRLGRIFGRGRQ
jgi:hypothetical protein